jgi:hypothetical protein
MATVTEQGFPNLANILARLGPDGQIRPIAELLNKKLDFIDDIPWVECNLETGHQISLRTGLPSAQWRSLNQGVAITKTDVATYTESTGMIEDRAEVDVDSPGNLAALRLSEEAGKVEMMTQEFSRALFYESTFDNADRIHGLSARYGGTTGYTSSSYVLKGTNAGVNARSIWLLNWQPGKVYGIYPKNSKAGLFRKDLGEIDCFDGQTPSRKFRGLATKLQWKCGVAVEDYRTSVRFQWDPDDANFADSAKNMYLTLQAMLGTVFAIASNARFYMDRTSFNKLTAQLASNNVDFLKYVTLTTRTDSGAAGPVGVLLPHFLGVPIRITDALVAETAIS